jgi:hypothetical protein
VSHFGIIVRDLRKQFGEIDIYLFDQSSEDTSSRECEFWAGCGAGRNLVYFLQEVRHQERHSLKNTAEREETQTAFTTFQDMIETRQSTARSLTRLSDISSGHRVASGSVRRSIHQAISNSRLRAPSPYDPFA